MVPGKPYMGCHNVWHSKQEHLCQVWPGDPRSKWDTIMNDEAKILRHFQIKVDKFVIANQLYTTTNNNDNTNGLHLYSAF